MDINEFIRQISEVEAFDRSQPKEGLYQAICDIVRLDPRMISTQLSREDYRFILDHHCLGKAPHLNAAQLATRYDITQNAVRTIRKRIEKVVWEGLLDMVGYNRSRTQISPSTRTRLVAEILEATQDITDGIVEDTG